MVAEVQRLASGGTDPVGKRQPECVEAQSTRSGPRRVELGAGTPAATCERTAQRQTALTGFERIFTHTAEHACIRGPTEAQLRELKRRRRDEAEYARGVKRARKAKEGEG
eukprot:3312631-Prymnesium_polylepis.1